MKRYLLLITLAVVFTVSNSASADLSDGLVAYWPFNGNANDGSGNGNHGIVNGAELTVDRFGNDDNAYKFDGIGDFINVPHSSSLDIAEGTPLTITAWVFRTNSTWPMHIVGKRTGCGGDFDFYQLAIGTGALPPASVPLNTWSHLAITISDNTVTHQYVNGEVVVTSNFTFGANLSNWKIGTSGSCKNFAGTIDEVRIYNRALSESEIEDLFNDVNTCTAVSVLDIDCDGNIDALTDGLLLIRYFFGFRGESLINNVVAENCKRCSAQKIEQHINSLIQ